MYRLMTTRQDGMQTSAGPIHVLHVDAPHVADVTAAALERADDELAVETAATAEEGLDRLANGTSEFDCVVADYDLPGQNGVAFLEAVREERPDLPFILYTGEGSEPVASSAVSAGVTDYLRKEDRDVAGAGRCGALADSIRESVTEFRERSERTERRGSPDPFFEKSPLGAVRWNADFELVRANGAAEEILGYSEAELVGRPLGTVVPDTDDDAGGGDPRDGLEADGTHHGVGEHVRKDGERIRCEWHSRAVTDDDGDAVAVLSQVQEVTGETRRVRRLEAFIDDLPGMVYRCRNDRGWPMEDVGGEVEALTGYPPSAMESRATVYGEEIVHPDDREAVWDAVQDALDAREPFELTYRIRTGDGTTKWVWERGRGVYAGDDVTALEGFITDVSERERMTRELRETNTVLRTILENLPAGILVEDTDRTVLMANERLTDVLDAPVAAEELVGRDCAAAAEELKGLFDDPAGFVAGIEATIAERAPVRGAELGLASGRTVERDYVPYTLPDGEANLWFYRDVTEREERERDLRRQNERLDRFASVVSHDLQNPLNVAQGRLELARNGRGGDHLDVAAKAVDRCLALVDDLLTLAREEERVYNVEAVDLSTAVESCWLTVSTGDATLVTETDRTIRADPGRLKRLLENLIRNAVEHGGEDVTVTVGDAGDGFHVADDGPGVPTSDHEWLFEVGNSTVDGGSGFGLAIVERIVEAHGWGISVGESERGGARFEITGVEGVPSEPPRR
jgi:PAS domain S-box-containing protein